MTTDETAIRINVGSIESTVCGITDAVTALATKPALAKSLGAAGYERVNAIYTWSERAHKIKELYKVVAREAT